MILRTPSGNAKNGMTRSQLRRLRDCRILLAPRALREGVERSLADLAVGCAVHAPKRLRHVLAVFPGGKIHGMADQVNAPGVSVLYGKKTTALTKRMELSGWVLTCLYLGDYYRTYATTVEDEVRSVLARPEDFIRGPPPLRRDSPARLGAGFTVRDGHYLLARWPGDAHRFAAEFAAMLGGRHSLCASARSTVLPHRPGNDHVVLIGLSVNRDGAECGAFDLHGAKRNTTEG